MGLLPAIMLIAACGRGSTRHVDTTAPAPVPTLPPGLSQPFALLHLQQFDGVTNALNAYAARCASRDGFTVPAEQTDSTAGFIVTLPDFGAMTDDDARRRGLHPGPPTTHVESSKPAAAALVAVGNCEEAGRQRLGASFDQLERRVIELRNEMSDAYHAVMSPKIKEADAAEGRCVIQHGWSAPRPGDVGNEDVSAYEVFGVPPGQTVTDSADGMQTYLPSPREIDLALALLHCRRDLGLPQQLLAAAKATQLPIVGRYEQQILQLNADIDAMARKAATVLQ